jgi:hypothetical protein
MSARLAEAEMPLFVGLWPPGELLAVTKRSSSIVEKAALETSEMPVFELVPPLAETVRCMHLKKPVVAVAEIATDWGAPPRLSTDRKLRAAGPAPRIVAVPSRLARVTLVTSIPEPWMSTYGFIARGKPPTS